MSRTGSPNFIAGCTCGYVSQELTVNGRCEPATCRACSSLVVTTRHPFTFDYSPCPDCGQPLNEKNLLGRGWFVMDRPSKIACPRCLKVGICMTSLPGRWSYEDEVFPEIGEELQARLERRGKIVIPDLHITPGSVWFTKTPSLPVGSIVIASAVSISTMAVNDGLMEVAHHRGVKDLRLDFLRVKQVD